MNSIVDNLLKDNDVSEQDFALEDLSGQLFGSKAIRKGASLQSWAVRFARSILQNSYNRYRMTIVREGKRLKEDEQNLSKARRVFEELEAQGKGTKAQIMPYLKALGAVTKRLTRWKSLLEDRFAEVNAELIRVQKAMMSKQDDSETIKLPPRLAPRATHDARCAQRKRLAEAREEARNEHRYPPRHLCRPHEQRRALDYVDACERLSQLKLTEVQQREIIRVILHCCGNEKQYNPYYALVVQQLCRLSHSHKITLQFCLWDFLRDMGESTVGGARSSRT
ncbi:hypothetical protein NUW54_g14197 [Trametes sanguinea]|uniref:Uncharacterized protein n=1 Tax=Trametes sanguinea TaxID=158606 RepID=A0ACC1MEQ6_9APHY|nr:hypothetical protein NUW54_g14197 [Trametes sanguinea]